MTLIPLVCDGMVQADRVNVSKIVWGGIAALILLSVALVVGLHSHRKAQLAKRRQEAYQPLREGSCFEFTIELVRNFGGSAAVFGLVTKGGLREGCGLTLRLQNGREISCVCKAIAGLESRLSSAGMDSEKNIGIWLDVPPEKIQLYDRLFSLDVAPIPGKAAPPELKFSILNGKFKNPMDYLP